MIEWYGTPPYCGILMIKISNKISHKLITFFFPKELKRIHYESQSNEFKSQRLQFLLFQKLLYGKIKTAYGSVLIILFFYPH